MPEILNECALRCRQFFIGSMSTDQSVKGTTCSTEENFLYCTELRVLYTNSSGWWKSRMLIASGQWFSIEGKIDLQRQ